MNQHSQPDTYEIVMGLSTSRQLPRIGNKTKPYFCGLIFGQFRIQAHGPDMGSIRRPVQF